MEHDLTQLEQKISSLIALVQRSRQENLELRQQLAQKTDENLRLTEKLNAAKLKVEALLARIPEEES